MVSRQHPGRVSPPITPQVPCPPVEKGRAQLAVKHPTSWPRTREPLHPVHADTPEPFGCRDKGIAAPPFRRLFFVAAWPTSDVSSSARNAHRAAAPLH